MKHFSYSAVFPFLLLLLIFVPSSAQSPWPVLEGLEAWPELARDAEGVGVTETAALEGEKRFSMRLNGYWYRKTGNDGAWERVLVPDVWTQTGPPHHRWYARRFVVPSAFAGKRISIDFGAVRLYAAVFLNGTRLGSHAGGFTPFTMDATGIARPGDVNTLLVYVKDDSYAKHGDRLYHQVAVSRAIRDTTDTAEGGIWQDVHLIGLPEVHIADIYVRTSVRQRMLRASITLRNEGTVTHRVRVTPSVLEWPQGARVPLNLTVSEVKIPPGETRVLELEQSWGNPQLWSPDHPYLYRLHVDLHGAGAARRLIDRTRARFGFREFWIDGPDFYLNGVRTCLRGDSDPVGSAREPFLWRTDFARRLMEILKRDIGLNALRVHAMIGPPALFNAADEAGVLLIDQSSIWSAGKRWYRCGGERFMDNTKREFAAWIRRDRNHPSVVLWDAENEMIRGNMDDWHWARRLPGFIRPFDDTRPIIHSGSGGAHASMPVYHIHHEENYTALYAAYNRKRDKPMLAGEYWTGGRSGERRLTSGEEFYSFTDYLRRSAKLWKERMDEQRVNGLAAVMPYYFLSGWGSRILMPLPEAGPIAWPDPTAPEIKPETPPWFLRLREWDLPGPEYRLLPEVAEAFRLGLSDLHAAFRENAGNFYAGERLLKTVVASNDSEIENDLTLTSTLRDGQDILYRAEQRRRVGAGEQWTVPLELTMPPVLQVGHLQLQTALLCDGQEQSRDAVTLTVYPDRVKNVPDISRDVGLFGPLTSLPSPVREKFRVVTDLASPDLPDVLVIGEDVDPAVLRQSGPLLRDYVRRGGRLLMLQQRVAPDWIGAGLTLYETPPIQSENAFHLFEFRGDENTVYQSRYAAVHAPAHPVFRGVPDTLLRWWRAGDGRLSDDILTRSKTRDRGTTLNMRSLAGGSRREYSSLLEVMTGDGVVLCCQLELMPNYGLDPAATRMFHNMLAYLHDWKSLLETDRAVAAGLPDPGGLANWVTRLESLPEAFAPTCRLLVLGPDARLTGRRTMALREYVRGGGVALFTPDAPLPPFLADRVRVTDPDTVASILHVRQYSPVVSGFNSWDCEYWTVPTVRRVMRLLPGWETSGLLQAGAVGHTARGRGRQIDQINYRPLGIALAEFPEGEGSYILSQLPLPDDDNYQARAVYAAIFTNLGVKLPE